MKRIIYLGILVFLTIFTSCNCPKTNSPTAAEIFNNPNYQAMSFGGYRNIDRNIVPTVEELKEDLKILSALNIKVLRTYNTSMAETPNLLHAISELKKEDANFEMYLMIGAWIEAENSRTESVNHSVGSAKNADEIELAIKYAQNYPDIVKAIAVGNECMIHWATGYFVDESIVVEWVKYLQNLKAEGKLSKDLWITSSDNFASWGGDTSEYGYEHKTEALTELYKSVDFISMHTYPFHDTYYNPAYWLTPEELINDDKMTQVDKAMTRAVEYAKMQYTNVKNYMLSLGINKPIVIGETGWASLDGEFNPQDGPTEDIAKNIEQLYTSKYKTMYGVDASRAADEFKEKLYYDRLRAWTNQDSITCFYFEIFDEPWKDGEHVGGTENHFGLIDINGHAKYVLWDEVDNGVFEGLTRGGKTITKSFNGDENLLIKMVEAPAKAN